MMFSNDDAGEGGVLAGEDQDAAGGDGASAVGAKSLARQDGPGLAELPELPPAAEITRRSRSNLAFAFAKLPKDRREDIVDFYAFCRWVDDLADDDEAPIGFRRAMLQRWLVGAREGFGSLGKTRSLERKLDDLVARRGIDRAHLAAIVEGMMDDLEPRRFGSIEEVEGYNWKVACCVGLVSIRIFGCRQPQSEQYAVALGQALQWTNILRDVGEDMRERSRVYLPLDVMQRFGVDESMLATRAAGTAKVYEGGDGAAGEGRFVEMMGFLADHARSHYARALELRCKDDASCLVAAEGMRRIYSRLLGMMREDGFRVLEKRYSLPKWRKFLLLFFSI